MGEDSEEPKRARRWPWQKSAHDDGFKVNWLLLPIGVIFVFWAAVLEHPTVKPLAPSTIGVTESVVFSWKALIGLLKEIGFALIIAWFVSYAIERTAKKREHEAQERARKQMASDVVHAVFGLQHQPSYVKRVVETTLQCKVVRQRYKVTYVLENLSAKELADLRVEAGRFVKLTQFCSYSFRNVSPAAVRHLVRYGLPARSGPKLHDFAGVLKARIDGKDYEGPALQKKVTSSKEDAYKQYQWEKVIEAGADIQIVIEARSLKELSDNEVWGSYHPTYEGMEMTVRCEVPEIARFGIRNLCASPHSEVYLNQGRNAEWKIEGPILPNDSVVFWWRSAADDGAPSARPVEDGTRSPRSKEAAEPNPKAAA